MCRVARNSGHAAAAATLKHFSELNFGLFAKHDASALLMLLTVLLIVESLAVALTAPQPVYDVAHQPFSADIVNCQPDIFSMLQEI